MAYYAKSDAPIALVDKPDAPPTPPLVIWGPGDPRPTVPIAGPGRPPGWGLAQDPGYGIPETEPLPPTIWGPGDPRPTVPIAEPPWGWGGKPPPLPETPKFKLTYLWTPETGWIVVAIPTGPVATPSKK